MTSMMGRVMVTGITFGVFMAEALIHYNMGVAKAEEGAEGDSRFRPHLPPAKELAKVAAVTGAFSVLSGVLITALENKVGSPTKSA